MKSVIRKHLQWLALGLAFTVFQLNGQIKVSFSTTGQTVDETDTVTITVELSEPSLLPVEVPYGIASTSTAIEGQDFEIPEDDEDEEFYNESPILFEPGEISKTITIDIINDDDDEDDELIVVDLVPDGLTVAELGEITRHTIRVLDNDLLRVYFKTHESEISEDANASIPIYLSAPSENEIEVNFSITMITADNGDIDLTSTSTTDNPYEFAENATTGSINVKVINDSIIDRNAGGADRETFSVKINSAVFAESRNPIDYDPTPHVVTIVDNDPLTAEFYYDDDAEQPFELNEYEYTSVTVRLVDPEGDTSSTGDDINIPISFGGGALHGDGDNDDYDTDDDDGILTISSGESSVSMAISINNDDNIEEDETIELSLGTPVYEDGGDVLLGNKNHMSFILKDNDPVTLSFGALYSKDDEAAAEDEDIEDIVYVPSGGSIAGESWGTVSIPVYLSSPCANNVEFKLQVLGAGTTATMYDSNNESEDQDWDYAISSPSVSKLDKDVDVIIRAGYQSGNVTVSLKNDDETPVIYGQSPAEDVEPDETIQFRISDINTDSSHVTMGEYSTYDLVIKELPDIDITDLVTGLSPDPAGLVNGTVRLNPLTTLFEADYHMSLNTPLNPSDFPGYRSLKARFRLSNYDASNPGNETNDPLIQSPDDPEENEEFHFFINTPYQLRFPNGSQWIRLVEGSDPVDDKWDITNADTIEIAPYILHPLTMPRLNDFEADIEGAFDLNAPLDWCVDFYSTSYLTMPLDRIDPNLNLERLRIYLTAESTTVYGTAGTGLSIEQFEPQPDGSMMLIINTNNATSVGLQYLDNEGEWRNVQPSAINTGGASKLYWVDTGPPQTQAHPSSVNFRLYRAIQN